VANKLKFILLLLISSCATSVNYKCKDKYFNITILSTLDKTSTKILSNKIINESNIKYDSANDKELVIAVDSGESSSLLSEKNVAKMSNIFLNLSYKIINKEKEIIESKSFKVIDTLGIDKEKRYISNINREYTYNNLFDQAVRKLESRISLFLNKCRE
jgi:hypothetical protein